MAGCDPQTFTGVTEQQFARLVQQAQENNIAIQGNQGSATHLGITMTWDYDPRTETLTIHCTDKPFIVGCGTVHSRISDLVNGSL